MIETPSRLGAVEVQVQRYVTDEETVLFKGTYASNGDALLAATDQLALVREHMARYNEDVLLVEQKRAAELQADIEAKGEELKAVQRQLDEARAQLTKAEGRIRRAG